MDVGPGDFVECVVDADVDVVAAAGLGALVRRGRVYRVEEVFEGVSRGPSGKAQKDVGLVLEEAETRWQAETGRPGGWAADLFRPIYRPKADLIESLKAPSPALEVA